MVPADYNQLSCWCQEQITLRLSSQSHNPSFKPAARRIFAPLWSARRHPIYQSIEIADEEQLMCLRPDIRQIIKQHSRSGWSNQHQGLDAILEEINKSLKALTPPKPSQKHWEIAARNCIKFMKASNIDGIIFLM